MRLSGLMIFIFLALIAFTNISYAETEVYMQNKPSITVTPDHPNFIIKLKSNPTTGYSWFLREYHTNFLLPTHHKFEPAKDRKLMGAPGLEVWTFHVKPEAFVVPQQTILRFVYIRPWETPGRTQQTVFMVSSINNRMP